MTDAVEVASRYFDCLGVLPLFYASLLSFSVVQRLDSLFYVRVFVISLVAMPSIGLCLTGDTSLGLALCPTEPKESTRLLSNWENLARSARGRAKETKETRFGNGKVGIQYSYLGTMQKAEIFRSEKKQFTATKIAVCSIGLRKRRKMTQTVFWTATECVRKNNSLPTRG